MLFHSLDFLLNTQKKLSFHLKLRTHIKDISFAQNSCVLRKLNGKFAPKHFRTLLESN